MRASVTDFGPQLLAKVLGANETQESTSRSSSATRTSAAWVGDLDKPKLVFFFDEAHLLFDDATDAFLESVERTVRMILSMDPAPELETAASSSPLWGKYGTRLERETAAEALASRVEATPEPEAPEREAPRRRPAKVPGDPLTDFMTSRQGKGAPARDRPRRLRPAPEAHLKVGISTVPSYPQVGMADAVELAAHTGLPVETVLRVLQRQPTNEAARRAVADAVAALGLPEYPRPDDHVEVLPGAEPAPAVSGAPVDGKALALELRDLFAELVERLERERRERVEDLELTTELIAETWRNVDRRLARLEKVVARLGRQDVAHLSSGNGAAEIRRLEDVWRPGRR